MTQVTMMFCFKLKTYLGLCITASLGAESLEPEEFHILSHFSSNLYSDRVYRIIVDYLKFRCWDSFFKNV